MVAADLWFSAIKTENISRARNISGVVGRRSGANVLLSVVGLTLFFLWVSREVTRDYLLEFTIAVRSKTEKKPHPDEQVIRVGDGKGHM